MQIRNGIGLRTALSLPLAFEAIEKAILEAKARATRLRFITDITKENIALTKEFMAILELRHLEGVKGNLESVMSNRLRYPQPRTLILEIQHTNNYTTRSLQQCDRSHTSTAMCFRSSVEQGNPC